VLIPAVAAFALLLVAALRRGLDSPQAAQAQPTGGAG
jgi:hypothetical protein